VWNFTTESSFNNPPNAPSDPAPIDDATDQSVNVDLSWTGGDPDGDDVTYDVYLEAGDSTPDVLVSNDQSGTSYDPGTLSPGTHYYWKIVATDEHGATRTGPVWDFTTRVPRWEEVGIGSATGGGISNNSGGSEAASIAFAPDGRPYIAWHDDSGGDDEIYVRRWSGSDWQPVGTGSDSGGGISDNSGTSRAPSMVVTTGNTPYVTWHDDSSGDYEVYVRYWNGSTWQPVGTGSASGGGISDNSGESRHPAVAVAPNGGTPYIVWRDDSGGDNEIYVRRWSGSVWEPVGTGSASGGGISANSGDSTGPAVAIAPDGTPYAAWHDDSSGDYEVYVRRWSGSNWVPVGTGSASGGGISNNSGTSGAPSIAIAPDGTLYVAWHDDSSGDYEIYVRRWNGSSWVPVGIGSASGAGISDNSGASQHPVVAITPEGTPYVVWWDDSAGDREAYIRRWNGSGWEEVGAGSASGGGISDNSGSSRLPWLMIAPDGTPYVAWHDDSSGDYEIYVLRWME